MSVTVAVAVVTCVVEFFVAEEPMILTVLVVIMTAGVPVDTELCDSLLGVDVA